MTRFLPRVVRERLAPPDGAGRSNLADRDRWLQETLSLLPKGSSILDAGAGELQYKRFCEHLNYLSQDISQYDGSGNAKGLQTGSWKGSSVDIISDIVALPLRSDSVDAVLCVEVIEHLPRPLEALDELVRVLRRGGQLIVTAPVSSLTHFAPYYYYSGFSRYFYDYVAGRCGLTIKELSFNGNYFEFLAQELLRLPSVTREWSTGSLGPTGYAAVALLLRRLRGLSTWGSRSTELLSYGIHLKAEKN